MNTTITDNIEKQLLDNIVSTLNKRTAVENQVHAAIQDFKDAIHIAFKYGMRPEAILKFLGDDADYNIDNEIVEEYRPKNRRAWRETQWFKETK